MHTSLQEPPQRRIKALMYATIVFGSTIDPLLQRSINSPSKRVESTCVNFFRCQRDSIGSKEAMQIHPSDTNNLGFGFKRWGNESDFGIRSPRGSPKPKSSKVPWKVKCFVVLMYVVATYIAVSTNRETFILRI